MDLIATVFIKCFYRSALALGAAPSHDMGRCHFYIATISTLTYIAKMDLIFNVSILCFYRSALAPGAAPSLAAAGASLAAAFLEAGMATGDTIVLRRLMALLVEPLAAWDSKSEVRPPVTHTRHSKQPLTAVTLPVTPLFTHMSHSDTFCLPLYVV